MKSDINFLSVISACRTIAFCELSVKCFIYVKVLLVAKIYSLGNCNIGTFHRIVYDHDKWKKRKWVQISLTQLNYSKKLLLIFKIRRKKTKFPIVWEWKLSMFLYAIKHIYYYIIVLLMQRVVKYLLNACKVWAVLVLIMSEIRLIC